MLWLDKDPNLVEFGLVTDLTFFSKKGSAFSAEDCVYNWTFWQSSPEGFGSAWISGLIDTLDCSYAYYFSSFSASLTLLSYSGSVIRINRHLV